MDFHSLFEEKEKLLTKEIFRRRLKIGLLFFALILNTAIMVIMLSFDIKNIDELPYPYKYVYYAVMGVMFVAIISIVILKEKEKLLGPRTKFFTLLTKLANLAKEGNIKQIKKYNYELFKLSTKLYEKDIVQGDYIFESYEKENSALLKNLIAISKKINHMCITNKIKDMNSSDLMNLAQSLYSRHPSLIKESGEVFKKYSETFDFPSWSERVKVLLDYKGVKFFIWELVIILLLIGIYFFLYEEKGILLLGFFTLTAANITVNLK